MDKQREPLVEADSNVPVENKLDKSIVLGDEMQSEMHLPSTSSKTTYSNEDQENIPDNNGISSGKKQRKSILVLFDPLYESSFHGAVENTIEEQNTTVDSGTSHDLNTCGPEGAIIDISSNDNIIYENPLEDEPAEDTSSILKDISNIVHNIVQKVSSITETSDEEVGSETNSPQEENNKDFFNSPTEDTVIFIDSTKSPQIKDNMSEVLHDEMENLQLKLNASQQTIATLELQLRQKEEVIIKLQAEATRKEQSFKTEMTAMKEKFEAKEEECNNKDVKEMEEQIKQMKKREIKLVADVKRFSEVLSEYDKTYAKHVEEQKKLFEKHEIVKQHLAALEMSFSDLHQKYERAKTVINGFKSNEETLLNDRKEMEDMIKKSVEKYETLKAHAKAQIEKFNKDYVLMCEKYEAENVKLTTLVKRLEIKNASLVNALQQKTEECSALAALCDEVTGKV